MAGTDGERPADLSRLLGRLFKRLNLRDLSLLPLLASNGLAIWWTAENHLGLQTVMMMYWMQSVAIGAVNVLRIFALRDCTTSDVTLDGELRPSAGTKLKVAGFFILHYGLFHVVYLVFILAAMSRGRPVIDWTIVWYCAALFAATNIFALVLHWLNETCGRRLGQVAFAPYGRIVPMHLAIIFGGFVNFHPGATLWLFQGFKTAADVFTHLVKHRKPIRAVQEAKTP